MDEPFNVDIKVNININADYRIFECKKERLIPYFLKWKKNKWIDSFTGIEFKSLRIAKTYLRKNTFVFPEKNEINTIFVLEDKSTLTRYAK